MFRVYFCPSLTTPAPTVFEKGGIGFYIALKEPLPDEVKKGVANFERVAAVTVDKENPWLLSGTIPRK